MPVEPAQIAALAAITFLGALIFGITGFGTALITIPLATHVVPLPFALGLFALSDLANSLRIGLENPRRAVRGEWLRLVPAIIAGTLVGVTLLMRLPRATAMFALGVFVIAYAFYSLFYRASSSRTVSQRWAPVAGFAGGITSTMSGAGGPTYVIYLSQRPLTKEELRATLGFATTCSISIRIVAFLVSGLLLDRSVWIAAAVTVPVSLVGVSIARHLYLRISRETLLKAIAVMLLLTGASLLARALG